MNSTLTLSDTKTGPYEKYSFQVLGRMLIISQELTIPCILSGPRRETLVVILQNEGHGVRVAYPTLLELSISCMRFVDGSMQSSTAAIDQGVWRTSGALSRDEY